MTVINNLIKGARIASLYKETDELITKAEGDRGGRVVGHTKTGKPVYSKHDTSYSSFTKEDHQDAHKLHFDLMMKHPKGTQKHHDHRVLTHYHKTAVDQKKHEESKDVKKAMTAGSTTGTETHNQHLTQEPLKEEDIDGVHKAGEGSHGGKVIGHTKSGNPIYSNANHPEHKDFTKQDHTDAIDAHQKIRDKHYMKNDHSTGKDKEINDHSYEQQNEHIRAKNNMHKEDGDNTTRRGITKAEDSEIISEHDLAIENQLVLLKSIDVTKLQKKEVQVRGKNGQTFFAVRYVNPNSGQAEVTGHKSTETEQHKDNPEKQIDTIMNHPSKNKAEKIRDFISLGIYDKKTLMLLSGADYVQAHQAIAKVGVTNLPSTRGAKTEGASSDGNTAEPGKDGGFPPDGMSKKDGDKLLEQARLKRRKESGLTYHDYWNTYKSTLESVMVEGYPKSLIAYGTGGLGKSHDLAEVMKKNKIRVFDAEINPSSDQYDAAVVKGDAGKKSMWATICKNKDKIIIFDDCDTMWTSGDEGQQNVLKGMLDTTGDGVITYGQAGKDENNEQLPKTIKFTGQVIFISNLPRKDFPQPLIDSRCAAIDLTMTKDETMEKIGDIKHLIKHRGKNDVEIPVSKEAKDQAYDFFKEHKDHLGLGQINGRTFAQVSHIAHKHKEAKSTKGAFEKEAKIRMNLV